MTVDCLMVGLTTDLLFIIVLIILVVGPYQTLEEDYDPARDRRRRFVVLAGIVVCIFAIFVITWVTLSRTIRGTSQLRHFMVNLQNKVRRRSREPAVVGPDAALMLEIKDYLTITVQAAADPPPSYDEAMVLKGRPPEEKTNVSPP